MNRELIALIASRAYPTDVRHERGGELIGTLLDAGEGSTTSFVRQLWSVLCGGLGARSREALREPLAQTVIRALMWAAVMTVVQELVRLIGFDIHARGTVTFPEGAIVTWVVPSVSVAAFTLKRTRSSGLLGIAWIVWQLTVYDGPMPGRVLIELLIPMAGFVLMALAPRQMSPSSRWIWVLPTAVFALFYLAEIGFYSGVYLIVPLACVLFFLPFQPSLVIGTEIAWSIIVVANALTVGGVRTAFSIIVISCAPVAVFAVGIGRTRARRQ